MIFPYLPDRDVSQQPCTIIREALNIYPSGKEFIDSPLIDVLGLKDIKCANPQITYTDESLTDEEIIARTLSGKACGFIKPLGAGEIIHLGTWLGFDTEGHKPVYMALLNRMGGKLSVASAGNDNITVRQRFTENGSAVLFAGNYFNEEQEFAISYTHPRTGETLSIPYTMETLNFPPLYAILSPVCMKVNNELAILHCTSDILAIDKTDKTLKITLYGDRDLMGELVLEGKLKFAELDGIMMEPLQKEERMVLSYNHRHKEEMFLSIKL